MIFKVSHLRLDDARMIEIAFFQQYKYIVIFRDFTSSP